MFGSTPNETAQSMGAPPDAENVTYGDHSTVWQNLGTAFNAEKYGSEQGQLGLMSDELSRRADQVAQMTGFRPTVYDASTDLSQYENAPDIAKDTFGVKELAQEKKLDELRAQGYAIPTRADLFNNVKQQVQSIQTDAADVAERSPGAMGWVARQAGSASGFPFAHPAIAAAGLIAPFEGLAARLGWSALQNGSIAGSAAYLDGKRQEKLFGQTFDASEAWKQAGYGAVFGLVSEGAVAAGGAAIDRYYPAKTTQDAAQIGKNLGDIAGKRTPEGKLAADLTGAKTPAEAAQAAANAPMSAVADLIAKTDRNPTTGVRGVLQGAEREILAESSQPEGMPWQEHVDRLQAVGNAIERGQPMPQLEPTESVHTPMDDLLNQMRKGIANAEKSPDSLLQFLAKRGGVNDEGGDLAAMDADQWHVGKPFQRKFVSEEGVGLDEAARAAHEAGYFPDHGDERPTTDDLLEAVRKELSGKKNFPNHEDVAGNSGASAQKQIEQFLHENNLDLKTNTNEEIKQRLAAAQQSQAPALRQAANEGDVPIGEREHGDIEREMQGLHEGAGQVQEIKNHPEIGPSLGEDLKKAIIQKFGKYDPEATVPLGPMSLDENGELQMPQMKLKDLLESIESDHEVLKSMTNCMVK